MREQLLRRASLRWQVVAFILTCGGAIPAQAQWRMQDWFRLPRLEPARVRYWAERLRSDSDPAQRLEALRRLADADPRVHADVLPALLSALRTDSSPAVRQAAAETLGRFPVLFAQAGLALEEALERDPSPAVRDAARQGLWNYHLLGYRSTLGAGGFVGQTDEPPLAPQTVGWFRSAAVPSSQFSATEPSSLTRRWGHGLPPLLTSGFRAPNAVSGQLSLTTSTGTTLPTPTPEPPLARRSAFPSTVGIQLNEPPLRPVLQEPPRRLQPPPIAAALPPLVPLPDELPSVPPTPQTTSEPPLAVPTRR